MEDEICITVDDLDASDEIHIIGDKDVGNSCTTYPEPCYNTIEEEDEQTLDFLEGQWSKDISKLPGISHKLLDSYFTAETTSANKLRVEGYCLFKDNYVKKMQKRQ